VKKKAARVARDPRNLLTSLILVFPLFIIYQLGVLLTWPTLNGADLLSRFLFVNLGLSKQAYLAYTLGAGALYALAVMVLRQRQKLEMRIAVPVLLESAIYALTMGSLIVLIMTRIFHVDPSLWLRSTPGFSMSWVPSLSAGLAHEGVLARFVMSCGAGVWEETVFRLLLLSGLVALGHNIMGLRRPLAMLGAFVLSAALFSAAHHIPPYGDPLHLGVFFYRLLAGLLFGAIFWWRGFAVAVYTHALYDLYVLLIKP